MYEPEPVTPLGFSHASVGGHRVSVHPYPKELSPSHSHGEPL